MSMSDEEWAEVQQEIPAVSDPVVQQYLRGRDAMVEQGQRKQSTYSFRQSQSPIANHACRIVHRLAANPPALWRIARRLPKGCLLRGPLDGALVDLEFLVRAALDVPGMHLVSHTDGGLKASDGAEVELRYLATASSEGGVSVWSEGYAVGTPVPLGVAAEGFPDTGREGFVAWLSQHAQTQMMMASGQDSTARVPIPTMLVGYEPLFRLFLQRLMLILVTDGVRWAELRQVTLLLKLSLSWPTPFYRQNTSSARPERTPDHLLAILDQETCRFRRTPAGRSFWGLRLIWTSTPHAPQRRLIEAMDQGIAAKLAQPHLLAGFDGDAALQRQLPALLWFRKQCAAEEAVLPFVFGLAGTPQLPPPQGDDENESEGEDLHDALLLGARRVGNPASVACNPLLAAMVRERHVAVETGASPYLPVLMAGGVACVLVAASASNVYTTPCLTDEPPDLPASRLSHEFFHALTSPGGKGRVDLAGLGSLAENSVRWALFEDEAGEEWTRGVRTASLGVGVKAERLREWRVEWEGFCLWVVETFGAEAS